MGGLRVPGCFVGNTVKRGTMQATRRPFSRAHFKACFALVLSTFGSGARVEQPLSSTWLYPLPLLSMLPLSCLSRYQIAHVLAVLPHLFFFFLLLSPNSGFFYFANVPLSPRLLCLFLLFFALTSFLSCLGSATVCVCVLLGEVRGRARGIASGRPVTCKVESNL